MRVELELVGQGGVVAGGIGVASVDGLLDVECELAGAAGGLPFAVDKGATRCLPWVMFRRGGEPLVASLVILVRAAPYASLDAAEGVGHLAAHPALGFEQTAGLFCDDGGCALVAGQQPTGGSPRSRGR